MLVGICRFWVGRAAVALLLATVVALPGAAAETTERPALVATRAGDAAEVGLTLDNLRAMPWTTVTTRNVFNDGEVAYRGPLMRDVLAAVGLETAESVFCVAVNDYSVEIPTADFADWDVILAMEADGAPLSPRETGPLWLIYPQSDHAELREPIYGQRLIWQLVRIEAR